MEKTSETESPSILKNPNFLTKAKSMLRRVSQNPLKIPLKTRVNIEKR